MPPRQKRLRVATVSAVVVFGVVLVVGCGLFGRRGGPMLDPIFRPLPDVGLTDIEGDPAEEIITDLAKLGVFEVGEGPFMPDMPVQRGEFVTWLVRANNIFWRDTPSRWLKLASTDEPKIYMDVPPTEHCFPYVQGMINAGYPIAFEKREFHYARDITREHMIFIRTSLLLGADKVLPAPATLDEYRVRLRSFLEDADSVTEEFVPAVMTDLGEGDTIELAFGDIDRLCPKKAVARREAALALSNLRGRTCKQAREEVLPKWVPLPEIARKELEAATEAEDPHSHSH